MIIAPLTPDACVNLHRSQHISAQDPPTFDPLTGSCKPMQPLTTVLTLDAGAMEQDSSVFACLSREVRNSILMQAFHQLDQRHQFAVVPLVSRLWRSLGLAASQDIEVTIETEAAADQLKVWVAKHGHGLRSFSVTVEIDNPAAASRFMSGVISSFGGAPQLCSLSIVGSQQYRSACTMDLAPFVGLTSLQINNWQLRDSTLSSISSLMHLRSLDLSRTCLGSTPGSSQFIQSIASDMLQLTSVRFVYTATRAPDDPGGFRDISAADVAPLCSLPKLKGLDCGTSKSISADVLATLGNSPLTCLAVYVGSKADALHLADWVRRSGQGLKKVRIFGVQRPSPRVMLDPFRCSPQLQKLDLSYVSPSFSELSLLTQLTSMEMTGCSIEDAGLHQLSVMPNLRHLLLRYNWGLEGWQGPMEHLEACLPQLALLALSGTASTLAAREAFDDRILGEERDGQKITFFCKASEVP